MNIKVFRRAAMLCPILGLGILFACGASETQLRGAQYSTNLEECNRNSKTLCESIDCENYWRRKEGRFPRTVPVHCLDGGITDAASTD